MSIDWLKLRPWQGSQQTAFEKLCVQLLAYEPVPEGSKFIPKGNPDAGVEAYWAFPNGDEWGLQAKFFLNALTEIQWDQIRKSFHTAVERHPRLVKYTVCIPQDRADPRLSSQRWFMDKWNEHVTSWTQYAHKRGVQLEIDYWGETELMDRLTRAEHRGKLLFWLNAQLLTTDWLKSRIEETVANVGPRYTPELNVSLPIAAVYDGLGQAPAFFDLLSAQGAKVRKEFSKTRRGSARNEVAADWTGLDRDTGEVISALKSVAGRPITKTDFDTISDLASRASDKAWGCLRGIRSFEAEKAKGSETPRQDSMFRYEQQHLQDLAD